MRIILCGHIYVVIGQIDDMDARLDSRSFSLFHDKTCIPFLLYDIHVEIHCWSDNKYIIFFHSPIIIEGSPSLI